MSEFPRTSSSEVSGKIWGREQDRGGVESLYLCKAGAAAMGEVKGGPEDWRQGIRGVSDRPYPITISALS